MLWVYALFWELYVYMYVHIYSVEEVTVVLDAYFFDLTLQKKHTINDREGAFAPSRDWFPPLEIWL